MGLLAILFLSHSAHDGQEDMQFQHGLSRAEIQNRQLLCLKLDVQGGGS